MNPRNVIIIGAGQSGLAAAHAILQAGGEPLLLEARPQPTGSWPDYYDSLTLFSPAQFSSLPGAPFPADPDHYPSRDQVAGYLRDYAGQLSVEIRTGTPVESVTAAPGGGFLVHTQAGETLPAAAVVAASGSFGNPYRPGLPGQTGFPGEVSHVADYRSPEPYAGKRVIVVGAGNSAVQVAYEVAEVAQVTLATREPVRFLRQSVLGKDVHHWLTRTGFDRLPPAWLARVAPGTMVLDTGDYQRAITDGRLPRREMFTGFDGDRVCWPDGSTEPVDAVLYATGYRPDLGYLAPLGALDAAGAPLHSGGVSSTHPGLVYLGLEFQRSFASNTLRGVHRDARHLTGPLLAHAGQAAAVFGL